MGKCGMRKYGVGTAYLNFALIANIEEVIPAKGRSRTPDAPTLCNVLYLVAQYWSGLTSTAMYGYN
jgi:hypothetical protein